MAEVSSRNKAVHFDGNTPKNLRTEIIEKFRNQEITILQRRFNLCFF